MTKPFEIHGVEAEKAEAMRKYNNRRSFRNILRASAVALLCYLWFPTVAISLQTAGDWFYRTGSVIITNRTVVFVFANLLIVSIFVLSRDNDDESSGISSNTEQPDLYDQYTSSSAVIVTVSSSAAEKVEDDDDQPDDDDDSNKQIVPAFLPGVEKVVVEEASKGNFRRTKSERKKEIIRPVTEYRRTESAKMAIERMSSEEFRLKVETFIMEKKRSLVQENDVVQYQGDRSTGPWLIGGGADSGYGSC